MKLFWLGVLVVTLIVLPLKPIKRKKAFVRKVLYEGWMKLGFDGRWMCYVRAETEIGCRDLLDAESPKPYSVSGVEQPLPWFSLVVMPAGECPVGRRPRSRRSK